MTSTTTATGASSTSSGVNATWTLTAALRYSRPLAAPAEPMYCYRHPDRETLVSCSECGRPICEDCMTFAPVGIRCPDHSGVAQGPARVTQEMRRATFEGTGALVTKTLIGINVGIYLLELALGGRINGTGNEIYREGVLYGPVVADGDYWRLVSAMFLHYGPIHLGLNMLALWWFGAAFVLERQRMYVLGGGALSIIVLNLAFTFFIPGISIGGHIGGLLGGAIGVLSLSRFGRGHAVYGRPGILGVGGLIAIGVASVLVSYWSVQEYVA